jgi:hypothetical protein
MNPYPVFVLLPSYFGKIRYDLRSERTQKNEDGDMDSCLAVLSGSVSIHPQTQYAQDDVQTGKNCKVRLRTALSCCAQTLY